MSKKIAITGKNYIGETSNGKKGVFQRSGAQTGLGEHAAK